MGLILTNAGDARGGHAATVAAEIEAGGPGEVVERRHLVWRGEQWINRHRGGIDRTELGFTMERCELAVKDCHKLGVRSARPRAGDRNRTRMANFEGFTTR
jgi:hypothetical protein